MAAFRHPVFIRISWTRYSYQGRRRTAAAAGFLRLAETAARTARQSDHE